MRKILLLVAGLLPLFASAQVTILSDDFEGLTAGELCAANSDIWTTWSGGIDAEDAYVSDAYAISGSNSVNIAGYNGPTDLVLPFPEDYTSGVYELSMKAYITSGNGGYFNIQATGVPGTAWMFEILFDAVGGGFINAGGNNAATVTYTPDTWMSINVRADLDNDIGEFYLNSHLIYTWQWSTGATGTSNVKKIGGIDIFSYSADGSDANMFVDNVLLEQIVTTGLFVEDFEKNVPNQFLAANNDTWTTWSGGIDGEDAYVSDLYSSSGFNSVNIDENVNLSDLVLPFPQDYTTGVIDFSFKMYMPSGFGGYFNVQGSSDLSTPSFMLEVYFNDDGTGYINAGGSNAATFTYTPDAWNDIWVKADLNTDMGEFLVNSGSIYQWQWSLGSGGSGEEKSIGAIDFYATSGSGTSNYYVDDVLLAEGFGVGVNNQTIHPDVFISPNPSNGQFTVMIKDLTAGTYQCQVVDALGRVMSNESMNVSGSVKKTFDLNLAKGIYFVKLFNGDQTTTKKIVIN